MIVNKKTGTKSYNIYTTYAEIKRLCNEQHQKYTIVTDGELFLLYLSFSRRPFILHPIQHPSADYNIFTNGVYYYINDNGKETLYKLRQ